ncbi:hypothetical protein BKA80DRAFT_268207, partial [Phyllosticta citrichinensis]
MMPRPIGQRSLIQPYLLLCSICSLSLKVLGPEKRLCKHKYHLSAVSCKPFLNQVVGLPTTLFQRHHTPSKMHFTTFIVGTLFAILGLVAAAPLDNSPMAGPVDDVVPADFDTTYPDYAAQPILEKRGSRQVVVCKARNRQACVTASIPSNRCYVLTPGWDKKVKSFYPGPNHWCKLFSNNRCGGLSTSVYGGVNTNLPGFQGYASSLECVPVVGLDMG